MDNSGYDFKFSVRKLIDNSKTIVGMCYYIIWQQQNKKTKANLIQAVSSRPLITKARVRALVSPCGIYGGQRGTGTGFFLRVLGFYPVNVIPSLHSNLIYNVGDEK
jgi:hypothetical protein